MDFIEFLLELFGLSSKPKAESKPLTDPALPRKCNHTPVSVDFADGSTVKYCRFCRKRWTELVAAGEVSE